MSYTLITDCIKDKLIYNGLTLDKSQGPRGIGSSNRSSLIGDPFTHNPLTY